MTEIEPLVTATDIAHHFHVSKNVVLKWWREDKIPGFRLAGQIRPVRFRLSEVEAMLSRQSHKRAS